jgi:CheY-like chemotaxis protein
MADAASQQAASGANLDVSGARVLVVDDDLLALNAVQSTLEGWGCAVAAAQSSDEALKILVHNEQPQVLIVDYLLQNGDTGVNLLGRVKNCLGIQVPAIVLSGVSSRLLEREVEQCGYKLLYKPTQPSRLRQALAECFATRTCHADVPITRQQNG